MPIASRDSTSVTMPQTTSKGPAESKLLFGSSASVLRTTTTTQKRDEPSPSAPVYKRPPVAPQKSYNSTRHHTTTNGKTIEASGGVPLSPAHNRTYSRSGMLSVAPKRSFTNPALLDNYHTTTLNPNYRPLENSMMTKPKPLEASLFVSRAGSDSGSVGGDSCVSLTISRSPSPYSNRSGTGSSISTNSRSSTKPNTPQKNHQTTKSTATAPYRVFPQSACGQTSEDIDRVMKQLEPSSVVFDANMSFFLGTTKQNVRQNMRPSPAHQEPETQSNYLSSRISDFLQRTDHVMDEWKGLKKETCADKMCVVARDRDRDQRLVGRSRSVTNIMVKGYQILQSNQLPPTSRSRPSSMCRDASVGSDTDTLVDEEEEVNIDSESCVHLKLNAAVDDYVLCAV